MRLVDADALKKTVEDTMNVGDGLVPVQVVLSVIKNLIDLAATSEPVKPIVKRRGRNKYCHNYACPACGDEVFYEQNYCSECGRLIEWPPETP